MRIRPTHLALTMCAALLAAACDDDDDSEDFVTSRASATADFDEFETFAIIGPSDVDEDQRTTIPDEVAVNLDVVTQAMRDELTALGLREVSDPDEADLNAWSIAATSEQTQLVWDCVEGYWYGYWAYAWDPCAWLEPVYTEYQQGTIVLGLTDPEREQVVFGGLIRGYENGDDDLEERIQDDVARVFDSYPGEPKTDAGADDDEN